jgi:PIN domain nuclease of toxin-antitoxin system
MIALDASALLALLFRETGHERVAAALGQCCLSTVNLAEVLGRFVRDGHPAQPVLERLRAAPIEIVPFGEAEASAVAELLPATQPRGLSLGDRACLALGRARGIPVVTADRTWLDVHVGVEVQVIR